MQTDMELNCKNLLKVRQVLSLEVELMVSSVPDS